MRVAEAHAKLQAEVTPIALTQQVALAQALGRVLAQDIIAPFSIPPYNNAAMDGYALAFADLKPEMPIAGRITAGHPLTDPVKPGFAYRIFTGAEIPSGLDTVVIQEDCTEKDGQVLINNLPSERANLRPEGEDVQKGAIALNKGCKLFPPQIALLAALGISKLEVARPLRIGVFSTGDELKEPGEALKPGQIYDTNRYALIALVKNFGQDVKDLGILPDNLPIIKQALAQAAKDCDLILTSGGVSDGDEDHVKTAITSQGEISFWKLKIKPGKPIAFGRINDTHIIGLPGNPVAAFLGFMLFVRPVIALKEGRNDLTPLSVPLISKDNFKKAKGRREFPRVVLRKEEAGLRAYFFRPEGSGIVSSLAHSQGIADLGEEIETIKPGDTLEVILFKEGFS